MWANLRNFRELRVGKGSTYSQVLTPGTPPNSQSEKLKKISSWLWQGKEE